MVVLRVQRETADDDFIDVQTYTRLDVDAPAMAGPLLAGVLRSRRLAEAAIVPVLYSRARAIGPPSSHQLRRPPYTDGFISGRRPQWRRPPGAWRICSLAGNS